MFADYIGMIFPSSLLITSKVYGADGVVVRVDAMGVGSWKIVELLNLRGKSGTWEEMWMYGKDGGPHSLWVQKGFRVESLNYKVPENCF